MKGEWREGRGQWLERAEGAEEGRRGEDRRRQREWKSGYAPAPYFQILARPLDVGVEVKRIYDYVNVI